MGIQGFMDLQGEWMQWVDATKELPPLDTEVLCYQPERVGVSGQVFEERIIMGRLFELKPCERGGFIDLDFVGDRKHSLIGGGLYWAFPAIYHKKHVTYWMELPNVPNAENTKE